MSVPLVEVHEDAAALATSVAGELLTRIADAQTSGHVPHIVLTGGTIADAVHHEIARLSPGSDVDWSRVDLWWGDERFVGPDDQDRNAGQARRAFLDAVGVDQAHVHEMASTATASSAAEGAAAYAAELAAHGTDGFEVVMLGVGPDGHVASLFPDRPELDSTDPVVAVADSPKPPPERISLTLAHAEPGPGGLAAGQRRGQGRGGRAGPGRRSRRAPGPRGSGQRTDGDRLVPRPGRRLRPLTPQPSADPA